LLSPVLHPFLAAPRFFIHRRIGRLTSLVLHFPSSMPGGANALAGDHCMVGDGVVLHFTILGWNLLFDYLAFRSPKCAASYRRRRSSWCTAGASPGARRQFVLLPGQRGAAARIRSFPLSQERCLHPSA